MRPSVVEMTSHNPLGPSDYARAKTWPIVEFERAA
jgi:hypothetical protein